MGSILTGKRKDAGTTKNRGDPQLLGVGGDRTDDGRDRSRCSHSSDAKLASPLSILDRKKPELAQLPQRGWERQVGLDRRGIFRRGGIEARVNRTVGQWTTWIEEDSTDARPQ